MIFVGINLHVIKGMARFDWSIMSHRPFLAHRREPLIWNIVFFYFSFKRGSGDSQRISGF
jgi:hypothetical protein